MSLFNSYCEAVSKGELSDIHLHYHDTEYGFSTNDDNVLFGRLILEINQAGLSWDIVLKKREGIKQAYKDFNIDLIASFGKEDIDRLLLNSKIIRMRKKIEAIIFNAKQIQNLQKEFGSFKKWLDYQHPKSEIEWIKCFKKTFKFTGNEITKEFLLSTSYLPGAHNKSCPIFKKIVAQSPKWKTS